MTHRDRIDDARFIAEIEALANIGGWELHDDETLYWTPGTKAIFGVPDDFEPDIDTVFEFFHHEDRYTITRAVNRCREYGQGYDVEVRIITSDEKTCWVRARGERRDGESKIRGVIQNITDQKRRRQQLSVLNRTLRHNLRNDLNVVQGYAARLQNEIDQLDILASQAYQELHTLASQLQKASQQSTDNIRDLTYLIHTLEGFSKQQAKQYTETIQETSEELVALGQKANDFSEWIDRDPPRKPIPISNIIHDETEALEDEYQNVSITTVCNDDITVEADAEGLALIVEEGIQNAIKHNNVAQPSVTVTTTRNDERAQLAIIDNGPGIPADELAILDQAEESPLSHSSGIGLWMLTWIVRHYGGDIDVRQNVPNGTILRLLLPLSST